MTVVSSRAASLYGRASVRGPAHNRAGGFPPWSCRRQCAPAVSFWLSTSCVAVGEFSLPGNRDCHVCQLNSVGPVSLGINSQFLCSIEAPFLRPDLGSEGRRAQ